LNEPGSIVTAPDLDPDLIPDDLFRRVGYYDFRAYTQLTSGGLSQGFVLVRRHTLVGTVQAVFRAGRPNALNAVALSMALEKLNQLAVLAALKGLPIGPRVTAT
jgi:hypothetical protein